MITIAALLAAAALSSSAAGATDIALTEAKLPPKSPYIARYEPNHNRYCVRDRDGSPVTGSILGAEQCRTSTEWAKRGLTITRSR